jgi:hypothetical protein
MEGQLEAACQAVKAGIVTADQIAGGDPSVTMTAVTMVVSDLIAFLENRDPGARATWDRTFGMAYEGAFAEYQAGAGDPLFQDIASFKTNYDILSEASLDDIEERGGFPLTLERD